jgi:hypothetical protein
VPFNVGEGRTTRVFEIEAAANRTLAAIGIPAPPGTSPRSARQPKKRPPEGAIVRPDGSWRLSGKEIAAALSSIQGYSRHDIVRAARKLGRDALTRMAELMTNSTDERVVWMATNTILERAYGKSREIDIPDRLKPDLSKATDEQLASLKHLIDAGVLGPKRRTLPPAMAKSAERNRGHAWGAAAKASTEANGAGDDPETPIPRR